MSPRHELGGEGGCKIEYALIRHAVASAIYDYVFVGQDGVLGFGI